MGQSFEDDVVVEEASSDSLSSSDYEKRAKKPRTSPTKYQSQRDVVKSTYRQSSTMQMVQIGLEPSTAMKF